MQADIRTRWRAWQQEAALVSLRTLGKIAPGVAGGRAVEIFLTPRRPPAPPAPPRQPGAERITVQYGDLTLVGYAWGAGPTVILAHGWEGHARHFETLIKALVERGFRVVAVDGPAHGASPGRQTNLLDYGAALQAVIEQHGPAQAVIGHSFGGAATMLLLARQPELAVQQAIIIGAPSDLDVVLDGFARGLRLGSAVRRAMDRAMLKRFGLEVDQLSVRSVAERIPQTGLVIHDRGDVVIPFSEGAGIAAAWPGARLIATDGLGHRGPLRNGAVVDQIVDFLRNGGEKNPLRLGN